ncbi:hypothetical protein ABZ791_30155 [Streptomyces huasconensis]|uniref:Uncharacterized protein n=1 Tax=Streptomyces huasconensis TaxID=1854574 RepID=A0ABV3M1L6_9ACTN
MRTLQYAGFLLFEVLCVLSAFLGVWLIFPPAAMILGGVVGALAAEQSMARLKGARRKEPQR